MKTRYLVFLLLVLVRSSIQSINIEDGYILVTGGTGYIGSHIVVALLEYNYNVLVIDNLSNSSVDSLKRIEKLTGRFVPFHKIDLRDYEALEGIFQQYIITAVIHLAGLKAVGESVQLPLNYYENNLVSSMNLIKCMRLYNVRNILFSSSATVYGAGDGSLSPLLETDAVVPTNPYGRTKAFIEQILKDYSQSVPGQFNVIILRYFNPVGAHSSGEIGEDPNDIPNNLMPLLCQVIQGKRAYLSVFGNDYRTEDGTGKRDYIHVMDLAYGHVVALKRFDTMDTVHFEIYNLGTGKGHTVLEVISTMENIISQPIPYQITARRDGDVDVLVANPSKAFEELEWRPKFNFEDMCRDAWNWVSNNPNGYENKEP